MWDDFKYMVIEIIDDVKERFDDMTLYEKNFLGICMIGILICTLIVILI